MDEGRVGETNPLPPESLQRKPGRLDSIWCISSETHPVCFGRKTSPRAGALWGNFAPESDASRRQRAPPPFFSKTGNRPGF